MKNAFLFLGLWLFLSLHGIAQTIWSEEFPFAQELPSNEMTELYQDAKGFIWIGTTNGLARYDGYHLQTFQTDHARPDKLTHNRITCIAEDSTYLWVGTYKGVNCIDKQTLCITHPADTILLAAHIRSICSDGKSRIWIAQGDQLLSSRFPYREYGSVRLPVLDGRPSTITSLFLEKDKGRIWICTPNGLFAYALRTKTLRHLPPVGKAHQPTSIFQDQAGRYWLTTWGGGLWQLSTDASLTHVEYVHQDISSPRGKDTDGKFFSLAQDDTFGYIWALSYNNLYAFQYDNITGKLMPAALPRHVDTGKMYTKILKDRDGNLWLSSYDRGTLLTFHKEIIRNHTLDEVGKTLDWKPNLLTLDRDARGRFWFIQDRFGICLYDPHTGHTAFASPEIQDLTVDARVTATDTSSANLWIASPSQNQAYLLAYGKGYFNVRRRIRLANTTSTFPPASQMEAAPDGSLWLRCGGHILYQPATDTPPVATPDSLHFTAFACKDHASAWATTLRQIYLITMEDDRMACLPQPLSFQGNKNEEVRFLCPDADNGFWIATNLGRILYGKQDQALSQDYSSLFGTKGLSILNLLWQDHHLWLVAHNRLIHYDTRHHSLQQYAPSDGNMPTPIFRDQAAFLADGGVIYAGGRGGFVAVTPRSPATGQTPPHKVVLTDLKSGAHSLLPQLSTRYASGQPARQEISLRPGATNLSIGFSALDYAHSRKIRYAYRLKGYEDDWHYLPAGENTAYYPKIPKGDYSLEVKATNADGQWQAPALLLYLTQLPAWYETTWAYAAYAVAALLLIYITIRLYLRWLHRRNQLQLQEALTQAKLDYFTNISHDLLTPLSVISCVNEYWKRHYPEEEHQSQILHHNISRLKRLLQQVLDFRKAESGNMELRPEKGDIFSFARQLCVHHFLPLAEQKHLRLNLHIPEGTCTGLLDFDKVDKILYNLLSNAVKYTPEKKQIDFSVEIREKDTGKEAVFTVQDEGIGIPAKDQQKVFERFYTGHNGSSRLSNGIGLALARELTRLHHGTLSLESEQGKGSRFTVCLPFLPAADNTSTDLSGSKEGDAPASLSSSRPVLLLVDDNVQLLKMMEKVLAPQYKVLAATNGKEALALLKEQPADLVVSDIMMPDMDGVTLCRRLKAQLETSHIPILMLTAKQGTDDQVDAYKAGADGYLAKPFDLKVLTARIDNLLRACHARQQTFRADDHVQLSTLEYSTEDTKFLQDIADCIHAHLAEEGFDLEELSTHLRVSKSTLHRKVKAMTGLTPLEFTRNIKLKYACGMLLRQDRTVAEVAYATGFSSPKYFTRCFKGEFGLTPSEYQERHRNTG